MSAVFANDRDLGISPEESILAMELMKAYENYLRTGSVSSALPIMVSIVDRLRDVAQQDRVDVGHWADMMLRLAGLVSLHYPTRIYVKPSERVSPEEFIIYVIAIPFWLLNPELAKAVLDRARQLAIEMENIDMAKRIDAARRVIENLEDLFTKYAPTDVVYSPQEEYPS